MDWFVVCIALAIVGVWYGFRGPTLSQRAFNRLMVGTLAAVAVAGLAFGAALVLHTMAAPPPGNGQRVAPTLTPVPTPRG